MAWRCDLDAILYLETQETDASQRFIAWYVDGQGRPTSQAAVLHDSNDPAPLAYYGCQHCSELFRDWGAVLDHVEDAWRDNLT